VNVANKANKELTLSFGLPSQNDVIKVAKKHYMAYATMKKKHTAHIGKELVAQGCIPENPYTRIDINCIWTEAGHARDPDNILCGGVKPILDAMVVQGVITGDSIKQVNSITATFTKGGERGVLVRWSEAI
jgi:hypothetical protein